MAGDIASNGHEIKFADSGAADENRLTFGASDDLEIYHDGSNSYIVEGGTGDLRLQAANLAVQNTFGQAMLEANNGGGVNLYYNTSLKASTLTDGLSVRGQLKIQNSGGATQYTLPAADGSANQVLQTNGVPFFRYCQRWRLHFLLKMLVVKPPTGKVQTVAIGTGRGSGGNAIAWFDAVAGFFAFGPMEQPGSSSIALVGIPLAIRLLLGMDRRNRGRGVNAQAAHALAIHIHQVQSCCRNRNTSSYGSTGLYSVAIGYQNKATGPWAFAAGGSGNIASQSTSVAIGYQNTASGERSVALGASNTASGYASSAYGMQSKAAHRGKKAYASGRFAAAGDAQGGQFILRVSTTDATATVLSTDNGSSLSTSQIIAATDTCISFHGTVVAMQNGAQAYGSWEIKGMLVNDGGTTSLAVGIVNELALNNASNWVVALSADDTNNALAITVTGEASHNIRWVSNVQTSEVTYA